MSKTVRITGVGSLEKLLDDKARDLKKLDSLVKKVASDIRNWIQERTQSGLDSDRKKFKPYSPNYKIWKAVKKKRNVANVDLTLNGDMLFSIKIKKVRNGHVLYFAEAKQRKKADKHEFGKGVPKRSFFAIDDRQVDRAMKRFKKLVFKDL